MVSGRTGNDWRRETKGEAYRVHVRVQSNDPVYGDGMEGVVGRHDVHV
jgi:hypothetical protein